MSIKITFPGNKKVEAQLPEFTVTTDQPLRAGGDGTAPTPFELFLSSLGTCAGIYVLGFCQSRNLPTEGIEIDQDIIFDPVKQRIGKIDLAINVPPEFPEKYHDALVRAANMCAVKQYMQNPPEFGVYTKVREAADIAMN